MQDKRVSLQHIGEERILLLGRESVGGRVVRAVLVALPGVVAVIGAFGVAAGGRPGVIVGIHVHVGSIGLFQAIRAEWKRAGIRGGAFEQGLSSGTRCEFGVHGGRRPCCLKSAFEMVVRCEENGVVEKIVGRLIVVAMLVEGCCSGTAQLTVVLHESLLAPDVVGQSDDLVVVLAHGHRVGWVAVSRCVQCARVPGRLVGRIC